MSNVLSLFGARKRAPAAHSGALAGFLQGFSVEVMPRTAEKIADFRAVFPAGTRIYIAHIEGTPIEDMVATAKRIAGEGFPVMPVINATSAALDFGCSAGVVRQLHQISPATMIPSDPYQPIIGRQPTP